MSVHSASADHSTADMIGKTKREIGLWDVARFLSGVAAGVVFLIGTVRLIILGEDHAPTPMTQNEAADLAIAIVMAIGGLFVCWLSFTAQRGADRRAEQHAEQVALFAQQRANANQLAEVVEQVGQLTTEVHDLLATEKDQQEHSTRARGVLAKVGEEVTELRLGLAQMSMRVPSEESLLNHLKVYIDALFKAFKQDKDAAVKDAKSEGFLDAVRGRLNGVNGHSDLRLVRGAQDD